MKSVWAVIPAYNESCRVGSVVTGALEFVDKVVVVDDGSQDTTFDVATQAGAISLRHIINLGKGAALKTGCDFALQNGADILIILDADGQHSPFEIQKFVTGIEDCDIVFSCREINEKMPWVLRFGNLMIVNISRLLFGWQLKDSQCGFKAITANAYNKIKWDTSGYAVENEMIINAWRNRLRYREIPIQTIYNDNYKGTTVLDGLKIVANMVWWRFTK